MKTLYQKRKELIADKKRIKTLLIIHEKDRKKNKDILERLFYDFEEVKKQIKLCNALIKIERGNKNANSDERMAIFRQL